jgi:hypothetical protein
MVGTIHQHHACKLCGHLRRGHICTNPNGKEIRLPAGELVVSYSTFYCAVCFLSQLSNLCLLPPVVGICNNSDVVQIADSLSLKAFKIIKV